MNRLTVPVLFLALSVTAPAADVTITKGEWTAVIRVGDEIAGTYVFDKEQKKPYLIAVTAPNAIGVLKSSLARPAAEPTDIANQVLVAVEETKLWSPAAADASEKQTAKYGDLLKVEQSKGAWFKIEGLDRWVNGRDIVPLQAMVTRLIDPNPDTSIRDRQHPRYYDHKHHKGVWLAVDEVNDIKFWAEEGTIRTASVDVVEATGNPAVLKVTNHWLDTDGTPLLIETTTLSVSSDRLFSYDITFAAGSKPATFRDTKEGMFAVRMPNSMREVYAKGPVVTDQGVKGANTAWGKPAGWIDYAGPVDNRLVAVTLMDDPKNPRTSRYHIRDYGLMAINPFGEKSYTKGSDNELPEAPLTLEPGQTIRFRYGVYVHDGDSVEGRVTDVYKRFLAERK